MIIVMGALVVAAVGGLTGWAAAHIHRRRPPRESVKAAALLGGLFATIVYAAIHTAGIATAVLSSGALPNPARSLLYVSAGCAGFLLLTGLRAMLRRFSGDAELRGDPWRRGW